jgi:NADH-quinone oxidoreductase subunit A
VSPVPNAVPLDWAVRSFFICHQFMDHPYFPLLILFGLAGVVVLALLFVAQKVGPKSINPAKAEPFESGNPPRGDARIRFSVRFYLVAMLFLIFDLEVVFLYPWAIVFRQLGLFGLIEMGIFLGILLIGFIYVWRKGALEWD